MKNTIKQLITIVLILSLIIIVYYSWNATKPDYIKEYQSQIDSAQVKIDSLNVELNKSDELIDSMNHELFVLDEKTDSLKNSITNIKKRSHEKINTVDKLNNTELEHFFTERYQR
jgi:predicted  nucleic acid-binding Zn-ribbon protein